MVHTRAGFAVCSYGVGPCVPVCSSSRAGLLAGSERSGIGGLPHVAGVSRENVGYRVYTAQGILEHIIGRTRHSIPFTDDVATNQALLAAITRVRNNVDRGDTYVAQIEEIVRIGRALRHRGTPSEDEEAAALVARLGQIQRLESGSESSSSETSTPADVSFPTPSVPSYAQVAARASTPSPRVRAMARGPASTQQRTPRGQRGAGSQARRMGARVPTVPAGVRDGAELLSTSAPRRAETPPPIGFTAGPTMCPASSTTTAGISLHASLGSSWEWTPMSLV